MWEERNGSYKEFAIKGETEWENLQPDHVKIKRCLEVQPKGVAKLIQMITSDHQHSGK